MVIKTKRDILQRYKIKTYTRSKNGVKAHAILNFSHVDVGTLERIYRLMETPFIARYTRVEHFH